MNQPTEDRIKKLEEGQMQLKEEVRHLSEQITEPIKIDHLEIARGGTQELLVQANKKLEQIIEAQTNNRANIQKEIDSVGQTIIEALQDNVEEVKTILKGHSKYFEEHGRRLGQIEASINKFEVTQQRQEHLLQEILNRLPPKP